MDVPVRIVYLGGKKIGYELLNYLIENPNNLNYQLVGVLENQSSKLNSEDHSLSGLAKANGIPLLKDLDDLQSIEIDWIISVQYNQILKEQHIQQARIMAVNLHMAPLPEYRGCNQFSFAIAEGKREFGTSLHRLEAGIDSGDIITERRFPIPENCFVQELYAITHEHSLELFQTEFPNLILGNYKLTPQVELGQKRDSGFHLRKDIDQLKKIQSSWSKAKQKQHFRATWFPPFAPPVLEPEGRELDMDWYNSIA